MNNNFVINKKIKLMDKEDNLLKINFSENCKYFATYYENSNKIDLIDHFNRKSVELDLKNKKLKNIKFFRTNFQKYNKFFNKDILCIIYEDSFFLYDCYHLFNNKEMVSIFSTKDSDIGLDDGKIFGLDYDESNNLFYFGVCNNNRCIIGNIDLNIISSAINSDIFYFDQIVNKKYNKCSPKLLNLSNFNNLNYFSYYMDNKLYFVFTNIVDYKNNCYYLTYCIDVGVIYKYFCTNNKLIIIDNNKKNFKEYDISDIFEEIINFEKKGISVTDVIEYELKTFKEYDFNSILRYKKDNKIYAMNSINNINMSENKNLFTLFYNKLFLFNSESSNLYEFEEKITLFNIINKKEIAVVENKNKCYIFNI